VRGLRTLFPAAELYAMYGLTEAFRSTYLDPALIDPFGIAPIALRHQRPGMDQLARLSGGGAGAVGAQHTRWSRAKTVCSASSVATTR
jgi:hypothetical protein